MLDTIEDLFSALVEDIDMCGVIIRRNFTSFCNGVRKISAEAAEFLKKKIKEALNKMDVKDKIEIYLYISGLPQPVYAIADFVCSSSACVGSILARLFKSGEKRGCIDIGKDYIRRQKRDDFGDPTHGYYYFFDFAAYLDHNKPAEASPDEKEPETTAIQEQTSADNADTIHEINVCEEEKNEEKLADKVVSDLHITSSTLRATFLMLLPFIKSRIAEDGSVTAADIVSHFHLPQRTVRDHLTRLVNSGHLTSHGGNRNRRYTSGNEVRRSQS